MTSTATSGNRLRACLLLGAFCLASVSLSAQMARVRTVRGDSTVVAAIDAELRAAYPRNRPAAGLLTLENPLEQPGAAGTEVQAFAGEGGPSQLLRIVATTWTPFGKYAVEYYGPPAEPPRFIFESAVFRDDAPDRPVGRNFWGQPSWERRFYLETGRVLFTETIGDAAAPPASAEAHARRLAALRALVTTAMASRAQGME